MILKGKKVVLRPVRMDDAPRFVKWFNDQEVNKFVKLRSLDLKSEQKWISERVAGKVKDGIHFCIETKEQVHIGAVSLDNISKFHKHATFGIFIGDKNYWNKGFGTEAAQLILDYGFKKLKLHKIDLDVYSYNPRAIKVYKKLGFKKEGIKREHAFWQGKFYNAYQMSILDREWKK
jgi:RimJ/RimL family protein N-acetyltransferase